MSNKKYAHIGHPIDRCQEEAAEVIQALSKVKRFGWAGHEDYVAIGGNNLRDVQKEFRDLRIAMAEVEMLMHTTETSPEPTKPFKPPKEDSKNSLLKAIQKVYRKKITTYA